MITVLFGEGNDVTASRALDLIVQGRENMNGACQWMYRADKTGELYLAV
jgi:hypothetical protein